jgi:hypothetical protein
MKTPANLLSRVLSTVMIAGVGLRQLLRGITLQLPWLAVTGFGMMCIGCFVFLQPLVFTRPLREMMAASQAQAIGPRALRTALSVTGVGCIVLGVALRVLHGW